MARYLPLALSVEERLCVVVGGGSVGTRRVCSLLEAGARVRVVAPSISEDIRRWLDAWYGEVIPAPYQSSHLEGALLAIAATDVPEVNARVISDARERGILTSDASAPERGDFVIPATLRRGELLLSVTTGGASPALASRIREELERQYGLEYGALLVLLEEVRRECRRHIPERERRAQILRRVAADDSVLSLLRDGRPEDARERALAWISSSSD